MDRNREARRGSIAAVNGGLSRRRQQRSSNLRDSPEEDGVMEMQETARLRDRDREWGSKKDRERDRDRDRSITRSKRRRGEDSSEESIDEEDDDDEDASVSVRFPASAAVNPPPSSSSSSMHQGQSQSHHVRRSFSSKPVRPPAPAWKVAEEMIGVSIPRKARSSSLKRSQEGGGGGNGELIHWQASTSPARQSPPRNTAVSRSSSNASIRKKKPISGSKHRPPKISKSSSIQEIEIEVAEVLFGMTRQVPLPSSTRQEPNIKLDSKDTNGFSSEAKSRVSSPASSFSPPQATSQSSGLAATAPKRKRPRPTSPAMKVEMEIPPKAEEGMELASPSSSEKKLAVSAPAAENGGIASASTDKDVAGAVAESSKQENSNHEVKDEVAITVSMSKEPSSSIMDAHLDEATGPLSNVPEAAATAKAENHREEKFSIDLMAPPPAPSGNLEKEGLPDYAGNMSLEPVKEMVGTFSLDGEIEKPDKSSKHKELATEERNVGKFMPNDLNTKKHVEKEKLNLDLQLDLEKQDRDSLTLGGSSSSKHQQQMKQPSKMPRLEAKQEKSVVHPASLPLTMPIAGWPGSFPHFGYMGQVPSLPAVTPIDGSSVTAKTFQPPHFFPPQKPKRCATHCYIAQTIHYNQQIARMNPFWPPAAAAAVAAAAAGTPPIYGAKPCNLNVMPPSEAAVLGNPLQGGFPGRGLGPLQDKASAVAMTYAGPPAKEKSSAAAGAAAAAAAAANSTLMEAHRKQFMLQQAPQPGSSSAPPNVLHGPAFIFPIGQQQGAAATRSAAAKSTPNATPNAVSASSVAAYSGPAGHPVTTTMSFNYAGLQPNDAQYLAILQNNGYPFPIPAHVGGGPSPYRGANPSQAMPFFNGSFYSSPMLHPSAQQQLRQQQQPQSTNHHQPLAHSQQGHPNTSTSSGSSSSQKHHSQQSQRVPGGGGTAAAPAGGNSHGFPASKQHLHLLPPQVRQLESEAGCEDSPSTADSSRASQAHKSMYGNFAMSIHPQNFALISPAAAALPSGGVAAAGGSQKDKQQSLQNQANHTPSQAYAMSFAPFGGPAAASSAQGIDFSSMVQNHALFQSLPEAARHHGYQQMAAAATGVAAAHATQHKKPHHEDGKLGGDPGPVKANVSEEGKMMVSTGKSRGSGALHSLSFSRPDNETALSTFAVNNSSITEGASRTLNLIQPPANGSRAPNRPSSAAPVSSSAAATAANPTASSLHIQPSQQQQHLIQLQKQQQHQHQQHQQQLLLPQQMSSRSTKTSSPHSSNNSTIYSDRMPSGSTATRIPQGALAGFPPSIIQGASGTQSPQWKASGRAATPGSANSATSSAKNQLTQHQQQQLQQQQQGRTQQQYQQSLMSSFGVSSSKAVGVSGSNNSPLTPAAAAVAVSGPPQNSVSKSSVANGGSGSGSPRASSGSKSGPPPAGLLSPSLSLQQQTQAGKNSPSSSSSNLKSSPANNRNITSNLGHPHISPAPNSSSSSKFPQPQQQQQKQPFLQQQHFFSNQYMHAAQSSQTNAAAVTANYYQQQQQQLRRLSEQQSQQHSQQLSQQQQQQQQQNSATTGVLSQCQSPASIAGSTPTSDPAKAAAGGVKGAQGGSILQHNAQYAASSNTQHPLMPSAFPYIHTMSSSVSVKPAADPKAAPGNDLKPEKR